MGGGALGPKNNMNQGGGSQNGRKRILGPSEEGSKKKSLNRGGSRLAKKSQVGTDERTKPYRQGDQEKRAKGREVLARMKPDDEGKKREGGHARGIPEDYGEVGYCLGRDFKQSGAEGRKEKTWGSREKEGTDPLKEGALHLKL